MKILILDADIDTANILKEQLRCFNYLKVYISTNNEIFDDLADNGSFGLILVDFETIANIPTHKLASFADTNSKCVIILFHSNYNQKVVELQKILRTRYFLKKPIAHKDLQELIIDLFPDKDIMKPGKKGG